MFLLYRGRTRTTRRARTATTTCRAWAPTTTTGTSRRTTCLRTARLRMTIAASGRGRARMRPGTRRRPFTILGTARRPPPSRLIVETTRVSDPPCWTYRRAAKKAAGGPPCLLLKSNNYLPLDQVLFFCFPEASFFFRVPITSFLVFYLSTRRPRPPNSGADAEPAPGIRSIYTYTYEKYLFIFFEGARD